ncbi:MAG: HAD hydrolase family protein [Zoogloeaceae bacterium]|jgi:3-deoxy-D-manno-octulosonate 8-phosphate phosphatase (KDO 8-P phosphatase)|nr:HAD hydrolase family protein [Zoogloeaceae bacterium]
MEEHTANATHRAAAIRLMAFDVDGVLTDGRLYFSAEGEALKAFNTLDGQGFKLLQATGIAPVIITGRASGAVEKRMAGLGIEHCFQGVADKHTCLASLLKTLDIPWTAAGYMGDDLIDLAAMRACGFAAAPANAHESVRAQAHVVTGARGGEGAAREICDFLLKAQGKLETAVATCLGISLWDSR